MSRSPLCLLHLLGLVPVDGREGGYTVPQEIHHRRYIAGIPLYTIMLIGRWLSDAFLRYIHKEVQEFSAGLSQCMVIRVGPKYQRFPLTRQPGQFLQAGFKLWPLCPEPLSPATITVHTSLIAMFMTMATWLCPIRV
jgi:hypothetical protein